MGKYSDRIVFILTLLGTAGLFLVYLSPYINPARLVLPALFGLAYPYLLILNLVFLCYWAIRLKREAAIPLIAILLGWNHLNNLLPLNFKEANVPESHSRDRMIKVVSYNVHGFDVYKWKNDPEARSEIFQFIRTQEPDIVCFQEYYTSSREGETHNDLAGQLGDLTENAVYFRTDRTNQKGFGMATYTRLPILKKSRIPFNSSFNGAMYTDLLFHSDTIRLFNVHLQSIRFEQEDFAFIDSMRLKYSNRQVQGIRHIGSRLKAAFAMRAGQAEVLANYIKSSPYPVIVAGDFNDTPQSYAYRKIRRGLHDAFRKSGRGFGNTYAGELPSFRIDYILYSDPLKSYGFLRNKTDYSDHFPISTWVYYPR